MAPLPAPATPWPSPPRGPGVRVVLNPDLLLVGGGLANALVADRLRAARPASRVLVLEAGASLGGDHTWSFHETDVTPEQDARLARFRVAAWPAQEVRFPGLRRRLAVGYRTIASARLHAVLAPELGEGLRLNARAVRLTPTSATLADGTVIEAGAVIDGRGDLRSTHMALGWQKFLGLEIRTARPHGREVPIIMDACVPQRDGYRFLYTLPYGPDRLLIEDTRYADGPALDRAELRAGCLAYAAAQGWEMAEVIREEVGVLPIAMGGDIEAFLSEGDPAVPRSGMRAALFHPVTGYSLPDAVRLAEILAALPEFTHRAVLDATRGHAVRTWRARGFGRLLSRMLFRAAEPGERWRVLARFYGLSEGLISRFYAGRTTYADRARILAGRPPVPLLAALRALPETSAFPAAPAAATPNARGAP